MRLDRYTVENAHEWDEMVKASKNGTFLFLRAYMDYHADRFQDHSLMFRDDKNRLVAVLPANERDGVLHSHQGLTYGGFVLSSKVHTAQLGEMFSLTMQHLRQEGFREWHYKPVPTIYHRLPAEDDEYWLWQNGAKLVDCSLMTVIPLHGTQGIVSSSKLNNSNRLCRQGYEVHIGAPITDFWPILTQNLLDRFNSRPVHTLDEILLLQQRFPENIVCCTITAPDGTTVGGTILYITQQVVKAQYTSASPEGKRVKALDHLVLTLLRHFATQPQLRHYDFGTSMLADSTQLNDGLVMQKEHFGGRGIASKIYTIEVR